MSAAEHWGKPTARNNQCNAHPKPPKDLVRAFAEHTGMSQGNARHALDRFRHICYCLRESENITLMRLFPGSRQAVQPRDREIAAQFHDYDE